jgi:hypothetical protein
MHIVAVSDAASLGDASLSPASGAAVNLSPPHPCVAPSTAKAAAAMAIDRPSTRSS